MEENKAPNNSQSPITEEISKKYIYIGIAGIVVLLALFLIFRNRGIEDMPEGVYAPERPAEQITLPSASFTAPTSSATVKPPVSPVIKTPTPLSATQKYLDAIRIYKNPGYYFQFVECHGAPGTLTMKKGKKFMLDNRDNKTRRIAIQGGQSFKIGAYNFAIATAPSKIGTYYITCDGGGAATILVQQ